VQNAGVIGLWPVTDKSDCDYSSRLETPCGDRPESFGAGAGGCVKLRERILLRHISGELLEEPFVALTTPLRVLFSSLGCLAMVLLLEVLGGFLPEDPPVAFFYFPFGG
jgi:hypothetical protein